MWIGNNVTVGNDGTYSTWAALAADIGTFTSSGTATQISDITEISGVVLSGNADSYQITLDGGGYNVYTNQSSYAFTYSIEGTAQRNIRNFNIVRTGDASSDSINVFRFSDMNTSGNLYFYNNTINGGEFVGAGLGVYAASPVYRFYTNLIYNTNGDCYYLSGYGVDDAVLNCTAYNSQRYGYNFGSTVGSCISNIGVDCTSGAYNQSNLEVFLRSASINQAGNDSTGVSGYQNLITDDNIQSITPTDSTFMYPIKDSAIYGSGFYSTLYRRYLNGVQILSGDVDLGAYGLYRFLSTDDDTDIHYAIELFTETTDTNTDIGLVDGVMRYVTDRPGYNSSGNVPIWGSSEWETGANNYIWHEGFLTKDGMSNPTRNINISKAGDYGTLSNFAFKLRNNDIIWKYFRNDDKTSNLNLLNKEVRAYIVIANVFYQIWGGVITDTPRNENEFIINCGDYPSKFHKDLPRNVIGDNIVPVVLGDNEFIKAESIGSGQLIPLGIDSLGYSYNSAPIMSGNYVSNTNLYEYWIGTPGKAFNSGDLSGYYLFVDNWRVDDTEPTTYSTDIDTDRGVYISTSDATTTLAGYTVTKVYCERYFKMTPEVVDMDEFNAGYTYLGTYFGSRSNYNNTYVKCIDIDATYALSSSGVTLIEDKPYSYDKDSDTYTQLPSILTPNADGTFTMKTSRGSATEDGFDYYTPVNINITGMYLDANGTIYSTSNTSILTDKDQTTYHIFDLTGATGNEYYLNFYIDFPGNVPTDLWILPDVTWYDTVSPFDADPDITVNFYPRDVYGEDMAIDSNFWYDRGLVKRFLPVLGYNQIPVDDGSIDLSSDLGQCIFGIPEEIYDAGGTRIESNFVTTSGVPVKPMWASQYLLYYTDDAATAEGWYDDVNKIDGKCLDLLTQGSVKRIRMRIKYTFDDMKYRYLVVHQLQAITKSDQSFQDTIYVKGSGVVGSDGTPTSSVYGTFKYILEDSDEIDPSYINYGNLSGQRSDWTVARQLSEQKNSKEYLKELAKQSYTALYPDRLGKRTFNAWVDKNAQALVHNENNIIRNSINSVTYTPMRDIYNDFYLEYDWDVASQKYNSIMYVTKTDESAFPAESGNWTDYVGGISDYTTASSIWSVARSGYIVSQSKQSPGNDLTQLPWYNTYDTVYNYLTRLLNWTSRQHININYAIPVTSGNLDINLTDGVLVNDYLYTNDRDYYGWINKIEFDTKLDQIKLMAYLDPDSTVLFINAGTCLNPGDLGRTDYTLYTASGRSEINLITRPDTI